MKALHVVTKKSKKEQTGENLKKMNKMILETCFDRSTVFISDSVIISLSSVIFPLSVVLKRTSLLTLADVSTTCAETILRVKWIVYRQ